MSLGSLERETPVGGGAGLVMYIDGIPYSTSSLSSALPPASVVNYVEEGPFLSNISSSTSSRHDPRVIQEEAALARRNEEARQQILRRKQKEVETESQQTRKRTLPPGAAPASRTTNKRPCPASRAPPTAVAAYESSASEEIPTGSVIPEDVYNRFIASINQSPPPEYHDDALQAGGINFGDDDGSDDDPDSGAARNNVNATAGAFVDEHFLEEYSEQRRYPTNGARAHDSFWALEKMPSVIQAGRDVWVPVTDLFMQQLHSLRKPNEPSDELECWGCLYQENECNNPIWADKWNQFLAAFSTQLVNNKNIYATGQEMYKIFQRTIVRDIRAGAPDIDANSTWTPYGLMVHMLFHGGSPEYHHWKTIQRLGELEDIILENQAIRMNALTGRKKVNPAAVNLLERILRMKAGYQRIDPSNLAYSCRNRRVQANHVSNLAPSQHVIASAAHPPPHSRRR